MSNRRWPLDPPGPDAGRPIEATAAAPAPSVAIPAGAIFMPHQPLSGALNGVNRTFQCAVPFMSGDIAREVVYRNGVRVDPQEYTANTAERTITFLQPPLPSDILLLDAYVETSQ